MFHTATIAAVVEYSEALFKLWDCQSEKAFCELCLTNPAIRRDSEQNTGSIGQYREDFNRLIAPQILLSNFLQDRYFKFI
jgi:hypothetical protein